MIRKFSPSLRVSSRQEWRDWLEANHAAVKEIWLYIYKKRFANKGITLQEAMEEAVCFGWVDSVMHSIDAEKFILRFTPRRKGAIWSMSNIKRVEKMLAEGKMAPSGMAAVEEAKQNGAWEAAIKREDTSNIPKDLQDALTSNRTAQYQFENLPHSHKKRYLWWIDEAKRPETRQRRIQEMVRILVEIGEPDKSV
ncbi:MAG: YdeI/OmpD-associated family protein [Anaerolineales bacterium]|nr:YdeI/OmpD-associated family protein [Anaerolineales bacterium]